MAKQYKSAKKVLVTGDKEIDALLAKLPRSLGNKILKKNMRSGLKPIHKQAKADAPKDTGELKKKTKIKAGKRSRSRVVINVISEAISPTGVRYPFIQEFGSEKMGIPASRWMTKTYLQHKDSASNHITRGIKSDLESEVKGLAKK